jgi:hypothetical protein
LALDRSIKSDAGEVQGRAVEGYVDDATITLVVGVEAKSGSSPAWYRGDRRCSPCVM